MKMDYKNDFDESLIVCAVRYCLGRQSYMPSLIVDGLIPMLKDCSDRTLFCLQKDIKEYIDSWKISGRYDICYGEQWINFSHLIQNETVKRKNERN